MNDKSNASARFDSIAKKGQALLAKEDRRLLALKHIADQAELELNNALIALESMRVRVEALTAASKRAAANFASALETK